MNRLRRYGDEPYDVGVLHGGPGALGDVAFLAEKISNDHGVVEPLFDQPSIEGQLNWLKEVVRENCEEPITLVGHSWGAWLAWIFAAKYDEVKKVVLVSSPPFDEEYIGEMKETLLERMDEEQERRYFELREKMAEDDKGLKEYGELITELSSYDFVPHEKDELEVLSEVNEKVWREAERLRRSGELLKMAEDIDCPVVAIYGDHDHHPYRGVKEPLSELLEEFKFVFLEKCGHYPWFEKNARDEFFRVLREEIG
ncbi:MAG: alpha/beta hydrolase [Candidatus Thermoplasmatota archaeon]